jgi:hypothetical protein
MRPITSLVVFALFLAFTSQRAEANSYAATPQQQRRMEQQRRAIQRQDPPLVGTWTHSGYWDNGRRLFVVTVDSTVNRWLRCWVNITGIQPGICDSWNGGCQTITRTNEFTVAPHHGYGPPTHSGWGTPLGNARYNLYCKMTQPDIRFP